MRTKGYKAPLSVPTCKEIAVKEDKKFYSLSPRMSEAFFNFQKVNKNFLEIV